MVNAGIKQNDIRQSLSDSGIRFTNQRALILDIIRHGQGHLDADEIHRLAQKKQPRISLSTVYRNLQTLKKLGLIDEVHFDKAHHHYEMKSPTDHHHLICVSCGRVIEFSYPLVNLVKRNVDEVKDFEITGSEVELTGYCPECRRNKH